VKNPNEIISIKMRDAVTVGGLPRRVGDIVKVTRAAAEMLVRRRGCASFEIDASPAPSASDASPAPSASDAPPATPARRAAR
jgi:hypothetical protein